MNHVWNQTIDINIDKAKEIIENQLQFSVYEIYLLDEGWDNVVYLVNQKLIFRFPRRDLGVICIENEINLLPLIAKNVSFSLSNPIFIGRPSSPYPYPFAGYTLIPGKSLCDVRQNLVNDSSFAKIIAHWLKELHSIQVKEAHLKLIKGDQTWRLNLNYRLTKCEQNLSQYKDFYSEAGFDANDILNAINSLSYFKFKADKKCFLHGDLYSRHIIVKENDLLPSGLIDWGDVHVGPPGIDLAVGMIFTEDILPIFLNAYGDVDVETFQIMLFHSFCHSMSFLPYAYEQNKSSLKNWATLVLNRVILELLKSK